MSTARVITGCHPGLFDMLVNAVSLIDLRDDADSIDSLDSLDLFEFLLLNLPGRDAENSLPDLLSAIAYIRDQLYGYDLSEQMFSENAYRFDLDGDYYILHLRKSTWH